MNEHHQPFEEIKLINANGAEQWSARQLGKLLGYSEYRHFIPVLTRAKEACENSGHTIDDHFEEILDMVKIGSNAKRALKDIVLSRYACYLVVQMLVEFGDTKVLCTASIEEGVPRFLKGQGQGWITAEYGMLPRSTHTRNAREAAKGKQGGRTMEIQRLIARALRAAVDLKALGEFTITLDCDVLQADGGTRTASITGACVALVDALQKLVENGKLKTNPMKGMVAAVSVGIVNGEAVCDLEYVEDSAAETDMNVVMTEDGRIIEVQGTAEGEPFTHEELLILLALARGESNPL